MSDTPLPREAGSRPEPPPVKLLAAILYREEARLEAALRLLQQRFSLVDLRGAAHPFELTDYYRAEMGGGLTRTLVSFEALVDPGELAGYKRAAAGIEDALRLGGKRTVNIDIGYLDACKLVLASFKGRGNKVYLGRGVWADLTLMYEKGRFQPLPWSFPDFRQRRYDAELLRIRRRYKAQLADRLALARSGTE
ncbi:MAG: DUF4416 family protein [Candidatus Lambdaproteobacteria bacterium]|nr:DUF4416 family protein [Candidatus Lambdaproteobacteria bacterium]